MKKEQEKTLATNRKALRDYHIEKFYETGVQLMGSEVKSLRVGGTDFRSSFAKIEKEELFLYGMYIAPYKFSRDVIDPLRPRKLLLHKSELRQIEAKVLQKGFTLVPIKVYFKRGYAKVELGLGRGKQQYDKRKDVKERQVKREIDRALRHDRD